MIYVLQIFICICATATWTKIATIGSSGAVGWVVCGARAVRSLFVAFWLRVRIRQNENPPDSIATLFLLLYTYAHPLHLRSLAPRICLCVDVYTCQKYINVTTTIYYCCCSNTISWQTHIRMPLITNVSFWVSHDSQSHTAYLWLSLSFDHLQCENRKKNKTMLRKVKNSKSKYMNCIFQLEPWPFSVNYLV